MGAVTGLLGVGGGAGGTGFAGPEGPKGADAAGMANLQDSYQRLVQAAQGNGPNPAMAQYNQNIQDMAKRQAGALSSVQGISPALATRLISQQGSAMQQNAAAQGATTQAQQQLGLMGAAANVAGAQAGNATQMQGNINNANASLANTTMQGQQNLIGGVMSGFGAFGGGGGAAAAALAGGGEVKKMADGGAMDAGPQSSFAQYLSNTANIMRPTSEMANPYAPPNQTAGAFQGKPSKPAPASAPENAGQGPTNANAANLPSSSIPYNQPMQYSSSSLANGGMPQDYRSGGNVIAKDSSQKAVKPGNSYANDKIPAMLSEGEVVLPRDVMNSPNPSAAAARFVQAVLAKRKKK